MERVKLSVVARGYGKEKINRQRTQDFQGRESGYRHYSCSQPQRIYNSKSEPLVNYELRAIMICQCTFISSNKFTLVWWGMLRMGEIMQVGRQGRYRKSLYFPLKFAKPKTLLKNKVYLNKNSTGAKTYCRNQFISLI